MCQDKPRLAAFCFVVLAVMLASPTVVAQTTTVDDFNDGILDGWSPFDFAADEAWGPSVVAINGKRELVLASNRPIPAAGNSLVGVILDADDDQYSDGIFRARLRVEEEPTETGILMRNTGSVETGFNNYAFIVGPSLTGGTEYCIGRVENTSFVDVHCVDGPIPYGEDAFLEASAVGDQLSLKFWPVNDPEPTEPQVTWADSHYSTGTLILYARDPEIPYFFETSFGAVYDDLTFTPVAAPADPVPEPAGAWMAGLACAALIAGGRQRCKNRRAATGCIPSETAFGLLRKKAVKRVSAALVSTVNAIGAVGATVVALRKIAACRLVSAALIGAALTAQYVHESRAQAVFDLGTFVASSEGPNASIIPLSVPAGKYNSYSMRTNYSKVASDGDPWSEEAIWALANGPLDESATLYVDPGSAPNSQRNSDPITLQWNGMLDLPITGPLDLALLNFQAFDESGRNFDGRWANTVLELSFVAPPAPPRIDMDLGVVAGSFSPFVVDTLAADFDTEIGVYSADTGQLIAHNDDVMHSDGGLPQSEIDFHLGLPDGDYYAVVGGFNTLFEDDFAITPGTVGGNYTLSAAGATTMGSLPGNEVAYVGFSVSTSGECDFDGNTSCDIGDLNALLLIGPLAAGVSVVPGENDAFDLTSDGTIDTADVNQWLADAASRNGFAAPYLDGDSNLDGTVNAADLNNLALNWNDDVLLWSAGDFTADGKVNAADLNALALNWRQSIPAASAVGMAVPEPSTWFLTFFGLALIWRRSRG